MCLAFERASVGRKRTRKAPFGPAGGGFFFVPRKPESIDNAGVLLRGVGREEVERGQVLASPGSITPHTRFECELYVLTKEEGGRHTPFLKGYQPQFFFRTTDVTGAVTLPEAVELVMPGDTVKVLIELFSPIALEVGQRFAVREGNKTVGAGVVLSIFS